ncbi:hypothetical protein JCM3766R1_003968 [Sporobolomyces carnicolor]
MNTLSYFLSTLRPTPPPSPRASTSELPLESSPIPLVTVNPNHRTPSHLDRALAADSADPDRLSDDDARVDSRDSALTVDPDRARRELSTAGTVPPGRRTSRKGKSRANTRDDEGGGPAEGVEPDEPPELLPSHDTTDQPPPVTTTTVTLTNTIDSSPPRPSWPFVARLARTWPFRFTASLYLLIRRFLSLFGLSYPPRPHWNSLLSPLDTDPPLDPEKSVVAVRSTVISLSLRRPKAISHADSPPPSVPPSPGSTNAPTFASQQEQAVPRPIRAPPRMTPKTLVLDLDETLIHSTSRPTSGVGSRGRRSAPKGLKTTMVEVVLDGRSTMYTVYKRPWVDFFLRKVSSWYTVIIFTASLPEYADPVIDWLDGGDGRGGLIGGRLFRSHCLAKNGTYVKDLSVVDPDLAKVCLVDNSPVSYAINQANGIPIEGWINDPHDECLLDLLPMLDSLRFTNDVRRVLGLRGFGKSSSSSSSSQQQSNPTKRSSTPTVTNLSISTRTSSGSTIGLGGGGTSGDARRTVTRTAS